MKHLIGIVSDAYIGDNEFKIDFKTFKKNGFDSLDYQGLVNQNKSNLYNMSQDEFVAYFKRFKAQLDKYGLIVNQLHALWDMTYKNEPQGIDIFEYHQKALLAASVLKSKYVVYHTIPIEGHYLWDGVDYDKIYDTNKKFFKRLLPIAKKYDVHIAIENLPFFGARDFFSPTGTLKLVKELNDPHIIMCLDTGHFNMFKEENIYDFLLQAGDNLGCLHIHDNNGQSDAHAIPHLGTFDWKMFIKGLKEIGFSGVLSLETKISPNGLSKKAYEYLNNGLIRIIKDIREDLDRESK